MTLDVILRVAFGQKECRQFRNEELSKLTRYVFARINNNLFHYFDWQFPWLGARLIGPMQRLIGSDPLETLLADLKETVKERKRQKQENPEMERPERADFIDMFLEFETDEIATTGSVI